MPTFDNHCPEKPAVRGGTADQLPNFTAPSQRKVGGRAEAKRQAGVSFLGLPAPQAGRGPSQTWVTQAHRWNKGSPGSLELPFGMWLLRETSTLPLFLVMLCYHHCQSGQTESPSRIKGARKADHLWRPRGPAAHGAGCREHGGRRGSGNGSLPVTAFSDFLAACGPEQRHGWLTLVCCEGVSSSKTQVHPGLA